MMTLWIEKPPCLTESLRHAQAVITTYSNIHNTPNHSIMTSPMVAATLDSASPCLYSDLPSSTYPPSHFRSPAQGNSAIGLPDSLVHHLDFLHLLGNRSPAWITPGWREPCASSVYPAIEDYRSVPLIEVPPLFVIPLVLSARRSN